MDMQTAIRTVADGRDLDDAAMTAVMRTIMTGEATESQIGGFLIGLRMKGETVEEIAAAARVMRDLAASVPVAPEGLVDTAGTGGDVAGTFNISTAAALIAAAAGVRIAKHGNRAGSSRSGSADVLRSAGVDIDLTPEQVAECIARTGFGFMFAPHHHSAMRYAVGPRREMGARTIFNLLGPLTNPAGAPNQALGVFAPEWTGRIARVLRELGSRHVLVYHSRDGLDEISIGAPTLIAELKDGEVREYELTPEEVGLERLRSSAALDALRVDGPEASAALLREVLDDRPGPPRDVALLNAGAAIHVSGATATLAEGVETARRSVASGAAKATLAALVEVSNALGEGRA